MFYLSAKGWLTQKERRLLKELAEDVPTIGNILNVGIEYGASVVCLRAGNENATILAADLVGGSKVDSKSVPHCRRVFWFSGDSGQLAEDWHTAPHFGYDIDLAFIDGDHTYKGVVRDTKFAEYIPVGGVIAFHDCYAWDEPPKTVHKVCPEVNQAVSDWFTGNSEQWRELPEVDSIRVFERVA